MKSVFIRLGVTVTGTNEEVNALLAGDRGTLMALLDRPGAASIEGDTYIPWPACDYADNDIATTEDIEFDFEETPLHPTKEG